jgi:hypothetical protein
MGKFYTFSKSRSGETVPAIVLPSGEMRPLHSMIDPQREAQRLVSETGDTGFVVFLGLGGGFAIEALLAKTEAIVLVIEFNNEGIKELFSVMDYSKLLENERFFLLTDPSNEEIKNFIVENYKPSLCGGIKTIPLRARTEADHQLFDSAVLSIQEAIEIVSQDYSVQSHFGKRWFSNIIRNVLNAGSENTNLKKFPSYIQEAAIIAAGPSLDKQISVLKEYKSRQVFIICCDTALPALLHHGIEPDAAVSIDCQHISYYHFLCCGRRNLQNIPLLLDIASPPMLSSFSHLFFSSGHPLAQYISSHWQPFPNLDTSGGNVTYACLSLAENLGAQRVTFFGADFSYVNSRTYARGTYIYSYFEKKQNRFSPLEAQSSSFLYRSPFLPKNNEEQNYRETSSLRFYREKLEEKAAKMTVQIFRAQGQGAPVNLTRKKANKNNSVFKTEIEKPNISGIDFLKQYREKIAFLPEVNSANYLNKLDIKNRQVFNTILPTAAAIKRGNPHLKQKDLIEETKQFCINQINNVLHD